MRERIFYWLVVVIFLGLAFGMLFFDIKWAARFNTATRFFLVIPVFGAFYLGGHLLAKWGRGITGREALRSQRRY